MRRLSTHLVRMKEYRNVFSLYFGERFQLSPWQQYLTRVIENQQGHSVKTISAATLTLPSHITRHHMTMSATELSRSTT